VVSVRFSRRAREDLRDIVRFTIREWGETQAERYLDQIEDHAHHIAEAPGLDRHCDHIRPGLRRSGVGSHVLFFRRELAEILVCRVLHARMLPEAHAIDDDDDERAI
jgi:toxin ParE1/3/4